MCVSVCVYNGERGAPGIEYIEASNIFNFDQAPVIKRHCCRFSKHKTRRHNVFMTEQLQNILPVQFSSVHHTVGLCAFPARVSFFNKVHFQLDCGSRFVTLSTSKIEIML